MIKFLKIIILVAIAFVCIFFFNTSRQGYTKKQCEQINANFDQLKIGMNKSEVIRLIGKESNYITYPNPGYLKVFPEQKTQWEIWLLCRKEAYQWQMIAFDLKTQKLIKVFYDDPDTIGF